MFLGASSPVHASTTFTVNNTADPGDGASDASECTLRETIQQANSTAGADTINFAIPVEEGLRIIRPSSELPP